MNYQQFVIAVKEKVENLLGDDIQVEILSSLKNNNRERVGLSFSDRQINISPTIYLEEYFEQYENNYTIEGIAQSVCSLYKDVRFEHTWDVNQIRDFSRLKSKVAYKFINAEKNTTLLQTLPHKTYLDFAIVFYILFEADSCGTATIPITNELISLWNTTVDKLFQIAQENMTSLLPADFKPMHIVMNELLERSNLQLIEKSPLYVLTNSLRCFGACCILYDGMLEEIFREISENYYLIPSSIHEMIIVPESQCPSREELDKMILEINETHISKEEVLADHAYYYNRKTKELS